MLRTLSNLPAALCLLALPASAQWASTAWDSTRPVVMQGFLVAQQQAGGVQVFSAAARQWTTLLPAGAIIRGSGDWVLVTQDPNGGLRGYSARLNQSATQPGTTAAAVFVGDDVALAIEPSLAGSTLRAYSAETNTWATLSLPVPVPTANVAVSRFVIGVLAGNAYHGFAARTGAWATLNVNTPGAVPRADGNVVVADLRNPMTGGGPNQIAAFSGVRGTWSVSPAYATSPVLLLDHNVATVRAQIPASVQFRQCAYSAYNAAWVTSAATHTPGDTTSRISDNVVRIEDIGSTPRFEAFGARPGVWAQLNGSVYLDLSDVEEDYTIVRDTATNALLGYSGLCGGAWVTVSPGAAPTFVPGPDHLGLVTAGGRVWAFAPATNSWAAPLTQTAGATLTPTDAMADERGALFKGYATRWNQWITGPAIVAGASYTTAVGGSVIAHKQTSGVGAGAVTIFDERCQKWPTSFNPGAANLLAAGRNVVISYPTPAVDTRIWGYSVQRGDWTTPATAGSLALAPLVEENVATFADSNGRLWAFGAPDEGHVWFDWPNGTEYHVTGRDPVGGSTPFFAYSAVGKPAVDIAFAYWAVKRLDPPLVIPGIGGALCLDPGTVFFLGSFGLVDATFLRELKIPLAGIVPGCLQPWFQVLLIDTGTLAPRLGHRCDPGWFF